MKSNLKHLLQQIWSILTDVPGWPDAPQRLRLRRLIPIALPVLATLLILLWNVAWRAPRMRAERAAHQPLVALETGVENLRLAYSEQQTAEIALQAEESSRVLLNSPADLPPLLADLKTTAAALGWDANLVPAAAPTPPSPSEAQFYFLAARGKLSPAATNAEPFPTLLAFFEKLPATVKWIDLMRLSVRADEQGKLTAEIHLRTGCRVPNEKTPQ